VKHDVLADLAYALIGPWDMAFALLGTVCTVAFVLGAVATLGHDESKCLACLEDFPIEQAEALAERYEGSLRVFHLFVLSQAAVMRLPAAVWSLIRRKPVYLSPSVSMIAALMMLGAPLMVVSILFVPTPWGSIVSMSCMSVLMVVSGRHRRFQTWCPWCRDDNDGDDNEQVPDPDPAPGKSLNA
jgi:hypothetical protein